jgi:ribosomal-protein-alanine N-acetyltransferase
MALIQEPFQPLETVRLLLRCVVDQDATATSALVTSEISRWLAYWPTPFTVEMATSRIAASRALAYAGDALPLVVIEKTSNTLLGWAMLNRDESDRLRGSFGDWIGEQYQGKGYMKELAPAVIAAGFKLLNLDVIEAGAQLGNTASFAVMRACGMKPAHESWVYAPARGQDELCAFHDIRRTGMTA